MLRKSKGEKPEAGDQGKTKRVTKFESFRNEHRHYGRNENTTYDTRASTPKRAKTET